VLLAVCGVEQAGEQQLGCGGHPQERQVGSGGLVEVPFDTLRPVVAAGHRVAPAASTMAW
jgi:hypothetical protein